MKVVRTDRGFEVIDHPTRVEAKPARLVQQSSAIGEYEDAFERPGSSALWIGEHHHLTREEVGEMVEHLQCWLATGSLGVDEAAMRASDAANEHALRELAKDGNRIAIAAVAKMKRARRDE